MKKIIPIILLIALTACAAPVQTAMPNIESAPVEATEIPADVHTEGADHHSDVDLTRLQIGDGKVVSEAPRVGYVFSCISEFDGKGARGNPWWLNSDGTWNATKKGVVDGEIYWDSAFTITLNGNQRVFSGNNLPSHSTGVFPIQSDDDAYQADTNPNTIQSQTLTLRIPAVPVEANQPGCVGGQVGVALTGSVIFSAFDALGRDAAAHETQDACDGHPQKTGQYHYHSLSDCFVDNASGHSELMGYAFDGFGIFGYYGEDGGEMTNADLDECHGHKHVVKWDGQMVEMYHYHATHEFPYFVGCFRGESVARGAIQR